MMFEKFTLFDREGKPEATVTIPWFCPHIEFLILPNKLGTLRVFAFDSALCGYREGATHYSEGSEPSVKCSCIRSYSQNCQKARKIFQILFLALRGIVCPPCAVEKVRKECRV